MRSAFNDAAAARRIKPDHLKALIRGVQCCTALRLFAEAIQWCDEGLKAHPTDKKLLELRAEADKQKVLCQGRHSQFHSSIKGFLILEAVFNGKESARIIKTMAFKPCTPNAQIPLTLLWKKTPRPRGGRAV